MDRHLVMQQVAKAPSNVTITPHNPDRTITFGGWHFNFCKVASPPNVMDLDNGRRAGTRVFFKISSSWPKAIIVFILAVAILLNLWICTHQCGILIVFMTN